MIVCVHMHGKTTGRLVHRLVAEAFIGQPQDGHEVNHKDTDKKNNAPENLEWVTRSQNLTHAVATTGAYRGERNSSAILSEGNVRAIRKRHSEGIGYKRLAKEFGITWGCARSVATRKTWAWLK